MADSGADWPGIASADRGARICVVGAGTHFLSGISYYTVRLANALAGTFSVSVIPMRRLLPAMLYPGRARVGRRLAEVRLEPRVREGPGVNWYWVPSLVRAVAFLIRERPAIVVFQWWTGTVLHSYIALALVARLVRARVLVEFHEVLASGEARIRLAR